MQQAVGQVKEGGEDSTLGTLISHFLQRTHIFPNTFKKIEKSEYIKIILKKSNFYNYFYKKLYWIFYNYPQKMWEKTEYNIFR